jgi:hypothetical protein
MKMDRDIPTKALSQHIGKTAKNILNMIKSSESIIQTISDNSLAISGILYRLQTQLKAEHIEPLHAKNAGLDQKYMFQHSQFCGLKKNVEQTQGYALFEKQSLLYLQNLEGAMQKIEQAMRDVSADISHLLQECIETGDKMNVDIGLYDIEGIFGDEVIPSPIKKI